MTIPMKKPMRALAARLLRIIGLFGVFVAAYAIWEPGSQVRDGRHDLGKNGMWLAHGWLGGDEWFRRYRKDISAYRSESSLRALAAQCDEQHITDLFPHLCPCEPDGSLPPLDADQTERFLDAMGSNARTFPWIGGPGPEQARYREPAWRSKFCESARALLVEHPRLAGVQLNIEPLPSGDRDFLTLLDELRAALPPGKLLSIAAYPPPTRWHPHHDVHWDESFFLEIAKRSDQLAVMMYDTALQHPKLYRKLMADWTEEILRWAGEKPVLLGVPTYADEGVGYHDPETENLANALSGIHSGLQRFARLPRNYHGVAIYCHWETSAGAWKTWRTDFLRTPDNH